MGVLAGFNGNTLDRLARSTLHLCQIGEDFQRKKVNLHGWARTLQIVFLSIMPAFLQNLLYIYSTINDPRGENHAGHPFTRRNRRAA